MLGYAFIVVLVLPTLRTLNSSALIQMTVNESPSSKVSCYCLRQIISQLKNPLSAIFYLNGDKERMLIVEQRGIVSIYEIDGFRVDTFMDIRDRVSLSDDVGDSRGLLSVVLSPIFDVTKNVYAYYIRNVDGKDYAYISVFNVKNGKVDPKSETYLLRIYQPVPSGNGGPMLFGDDGYLYIVTGDGGELDDLNGRAQNLNTFYGKVLRIDVKEQGFSEGESGIAMPYTVPRSNPFVNITNARSEVYALGIRNMWGCSQDSITISGGTGRIFCAETGTSKYDEINIIERGHNYGWNLMEGVECRHDNACIPLENEGHPIHTFTHTSSHSLVGGHVYRGHDFVQMTANYIFGDAITGKTYFLEETSSGKWTNYQWDICETHKCPSDAKDNRLNHILAFGQDIKGELYLLMTDEMISVSDSGKMLKLVHPSSSSSGIQSYTALLIGCATSLASLRHWMRWGKK